MRFPALHYTSHLRAIIFLLPIQWLLMPRAPESQANNGRPARKGRKWGCEGLRVLRSDLSNQFRTKCGVRLGTDRGRNCYSLFLFIWMTFDNTRVISVVMMLVAGARAQKERISDCVVANFVSFFCWCDYPWMEQVFDYIKEQGGRCPP